MAMGEAG